MKLFSVRLSLKAKMCVLFGSLLLAGFAIFSLITVRETRSVLLTFLNAASSNAVMRADSVINSRNVEVVFDAINDADGDEEKYALIEQMPEYVVTQKALMNLRKSTDLKYLYIMFVDDKGKPRYAIDSMTAEEDGDLYTPPGDEANTDEFFFVALKEGRAVATDVIYDPDYGHLIIAYQPIKDAHGKVIGVIGADHDARSTIAAGVTLGYKIAIMSLVIFAVSLCITYISARFLTASLNRMMVMIKRIGEGDYSFSRADFNVKTHDEMGAMADALAELVSTQRKFISKIKNSVETNNMQSKELNDQARGALDAVDSIKGAVEKAHDGFESSFASLKACNTNTQDMSTSASDMAKATNSGTTFAATVEEITTNTLNESLNVLGNIRAGAEKVKESGDGLSGLESTVAAIKEFMAKIHGIAYQTNMLALNASIEAARAGDAGRGFSVVAGNVRQLAEESKRAANEVEQQINSLLSVTEHALQLHTESQEKMQEALSQTEKMTELLKQEESHTNELKKVIVSIDEAANRQDEISRKTSETLSGITDEIQRIEGSINDIRVQADGSADAATGVTSVAERLLKMNNDITELMEFYKV